MAKKELERRAFLFDIRAEESENGKIITGRPVVYNSKTDIGWFDEIIEQGALDKTDLTDVRFLVNHDTSRIPLARSRRNTPNSTMQLQTDAEGMAIRVNLDTENNTEAKSLYSAVQRGDITGMSFMFAVDGESWEDLESDHPTRRITSISTIVEVSAVTFPAYAATSIDVDERSKEALENARLALENARRSAEDKGLVETDLEYLREKIRNTILIGG